MGPVDLSTEQKAQIDTFLKNSYDDSYKNSRSNEDFKKKIDEKKEKDTNIQNIAKTTDKDKFDKYYGDKYKEYSEKFDKDNALREKKEKEEREKELRDEIKSQYKDKFIKNAFILAPVF